MKVLLRKTAQELVPFLPGTGNRVIKNLCNYFSPKILYTYIGARSNNMQSWRTVRDDLRCCESRGFNYQGIPSQE
jgi:hypothetical protein